MLLLAVFLFSVMHLQAQNESKGSLKGRVADTTLHQVLNQATVTILNAKDSSVSTFGLTDDKGFVTGNYIQDVQTKVLTRYALLTFTYNLRNFAAQQKGGPSFYRNRGGGGGPQRF